MEDTGLHDLSGMGSIPLFKTVDIRTAKAVKRIFSISKDACFSNSKFSEIRVRLTFEVSKNQCQNVTLFGQNARHIFIFTTLVTREETQK
jgi:hypothetical protein